MAFSFGTSTTGGLFRPQTSAPATGGLTFGAPQTSTAPAFGFGAPQTSAAPAFSFGTSQPSAAPAFGFGTTQTSTAAPSFGFGAPQTSAAPSFGFGTTQTSTAAPAFGFGAAQTTSAAPTFGFGTAQTQTAAPSFGFGAPQSSAAPTFGFGAPATSTTGGLFGGTGTFGGFGTSTVAPLGGATAAQPSFALFGASQQPQQQPQAGQQQQQQQSGLDAVIYSTVYCNVYGDERDAVLSRWNVLQAAWGTGKGFYSSTAGPVEYTSSNSLCRFKSIGYSKLPEAKNEDGIVGLLFNKSDSDVRQNQAQLVQTVSAAFGSKPNLSVVVEGVSGLDANKTEVLISMQERSATGAVHKAPASDLSSFLWQQPAVRAQLTAIGVVNCVPKMRPSSEQLREYLATPPAGIDARLWKQAQAENPDPEHFVPIPLIGFGDLVRHLHQQEKETRWHQGTLDKLAEELSNLQSRAAEASVALSEQRRRHIDLQHRVLKMLIKQECSRKEGFSLQPEEERLRVQLESIHNELSIPTQFRGRLNELLSQIRMRQSAFTPAEKMSERYHMEPSVLDELKQVLKTQQEGMAQLMNILKADLADFQVLENALKSH